MYATHSEGITAQQILTHTPCEQNTLLIEQTQISEEQKASTSLSSLILAPLTPIMPPAKLW